MVREELLKQIEKHFSEVLLLARQGGISDEELIEIFELIKQGEE